MKKALCIALLAALCATGAQAATSPTVVLYTDPTSDGVVLGPALPPTVDLIEGAIAETDTHLIIMWKVATIVDGTNGMPGTQRLDFEFTLDVPNDGKPAEDFGVRLETSRTGGTTGYIDASCTEAPKNSSVTCTRMNGAVVTTSVDAASDTFRAEVRRSDLKAGGVSVAVDGAVLAEKRMYRGIASYLGIAGSLVTHNLSDQADITTPYVLGSAWNA